MKAITTAVISAAVLTVALTGCGSESSSSRASNSPVAATTAPKATTSTVAATPTTSPPVAPTTPATTIKPPVVSTPSTSRAASGKSTAAVMPNVVCMNLQAAQNKIQEYGVFYSRSKDATGKGRKQIVDSNWVVIAQSPAPGTPFGEGDAVLSVVKYGETTQC